MKIILATLASTLVFGSVNAQTPTDSVGLFAIHNDVATRIDKITHTGIKGSGGLASMATFGVAKIKSKLEFKGATSEHQFEGMATLRMYFGNPSPQQMMNLYMFTPTYSTKNFDVARFDIKKGKRLLTGVTASITGSSVGVASAEDIQIETKELRSGVYDVTIKGKPGEYCLMFTANGTGGFGGVFDFTIK
jgi:hypothetical protein